MKLICLLFVSSEVTPLAVIRPRNTITPETALRLEACFGWPAAYWLQNQAEHDLARARESAGARIRAEVRSVRDSA